MHVHLASLTRSLMCGNVLEQKVVPNLPISKGIRLT